MERGLFRKAMANAELEASCSLEGLAVSGESAAPSASLSGAEGGGEGANAFEERHFVWRKNAAFFYDAVLSHKLDWPSLTVSDATSCRVQRDSACLLCSSRMSGRRVTE